MMISLIDETDDSVELTKKELKLKCLTKRNIIKKRKQINEKIKEGKKERRRKKVETLYDKEECERTKIIFSTIVSLVETNNLDDLNQFIRNEYYEEEEHFTTIESMNSNQSLSYLSEIPRSRRSENALFECPPRRESLSRISMEEKKLGVSNETAIDVDISQSSDIQFVDANGNPIDFVKERVQSIEILSEPPNIFKKSTKEDDKNIFEIEQLESGVDIANTDISLNTTHDAKEYVETLPMKLNGNEAVMEIDEVNRVGATEKIEERQRTSSLTIERKAILEKKPKKKKPTFLQRMKNARTRRNTKGKKERTNEDQQ